MQNPLKILVVQRLVVLLTFLVLTTGSLTGKQSDRASKVPATVVGYKVTDIYSKVGGYLESVSVNIGDKVSEGQILAVLDIPELQTELLQKKALVKQSEAGLVQAEAALNQATQRMKSLSASVLEAKTHVEQMTAMMNMAQSERDRITRLVNSGAVNQARLDEATFKFTAAKSEKLSTDAHIATVEANLASGQAAIASAEANVTAAKANIQVANANSAYVDKMIEYCTIRAPYAGKITKRFFDEGAFVQSAEGNSAARPIFQIVFTDKVRIVANISMSQIADFELDGQVEFSQIDALPDAVFDGKIDRRSAGVDEKTRMLRIEMDLDNQDGRLKPGYFGYLKVKK